MSGLGHLLLLFTPQVIPMLIFKSVCDCVLVTQLFIIQTLRVGTGGSKVESGASQGENIAGCDVPLIFFLLLISNLKF